MGLFKRSFVRGINHELVRRGVVAYPSKEAADEAADAVADAAPAEGPGAIPEVSPEEGHPPQDIAAIANKLMEIAAALMAQAGGGGAPPPMGGGMPPPMGGDMPPGGGAGLPPEIAKAASELQKTAEAADLETLASEVAVACMDKAAAETKQANNTGTLVVGGTQQNTPAAAAKDNAVAALDLKNRPEGAYHTGVGKTELDTAKGAVGNLGTPTKSPSNSPSGSNSVTEGTKSSALQAELRKVANKLVGLHDGKDSNTLAQAGAHDPIAKLDAKHRPQGKYHVGQGKTNIGEVEAARIGKEQKHPEAPTNTPAGTNSAIQASKTSEEDAFITLFKKCAEDVGAYLPSTLSDDEKIAAISHMIGFDHDGRQAHIDSLHTKVAAVVETPAVKPAEKAATDLSGIMNAMKGDEAKYKKPEAKDETKKEGALLNRIREIAAANTQPTA